MRMVNRPAKTEWTLAAILIGALMIWALFAVIGRPAREPQPTVSNLTVQPGAWDRFPNACRAPGLDGISPDCLEGYSTQEREAMRCATEDQGKDGTPDLYPCLWINPQTGQLYFIPAEK